MKTKKMLFKAAVCLMVVMFVFSSVSALAADYYTTTTFNLVTGLATVRTTVTGASGEVAYLAYTGDDAEADDAIFYIDQVTGSGNDVFEYTVAAEKVTGTHAMLVGTTDGKLATDDETVNYFGTDYTLTVNVENCELTLTDASNTEAVPNAKVFAEDGSVTVGNGNNLTYAVTDVKEGYDINTAVVTLNGEVIDGTSFTVTADATLEVTVDVAKKVTEAAKETAPVEGEGVAEADPELNAGGEEVAIKALTKFGKIEMGDDAVTAYGIIITDSEDRTMTINGGNIDLLSATNGAFAIIIEGLADDFEDTLKIKTFVTVGETTTYGTEYTYTNGVASIPAN